MSTWGFHQESCPRAVTVYGVERTMRSGSVWPNIAAKFHACSSPQFFAGGMSFASPFGAPASIHRTIVSICESLNDRSYLNCWIPTPLSMCHGGICRAATRVLIDFAHGRASS